jgi:hypothetical protein
MQRRGVLSTYSHSCGGSVYNNNYIIDASHCVDGYYYFKKWNIRPKAFDFFFPF